MLKTIFLFSLTGFLVICGLSILALHVETLVSSGWDAAKDQLSFPAIIFPIEAVRSRGFSFGVVVAGGLGAWLGPLLFEKLIVKKWRLVSEIDFRKLMKRE